MIRIFACGCTFLALILLTLSGVADAQTAAGKAKKNQMVKGTIKSVDVSKDLLVVNQKVKNETVDRELSILDTTAFVVMTGSEKKEVVGKDGLKLLEGKEGSPVQVKCDKDVNVLKVTVKIKK
jgi:hypothetical protein